MPPKGYTGFNNIDIVWGIKPVKLVAKIGTRIYIDYPVKITYDIKSNDEILSVGIAINKARHEYCELDWSNVYYTIGKFAYQDIFEEK